MTTDIFHSSFKEEPYWWEAYRPERGPAGDIPKEVRVVVVGGGYAGLACALELGEAGVSCCVLEAGELGQGASTRSGGAVSGGISVGKSFTGRRFSGSAQEVEKILVSAGDAFTEIEQLIARERIECSWVKSGRFVGAWTPAHYERLRQLVENQNSYAHAGARMVPRHLQHDEMDSDFYHGGMVVERTAKLHPALFYKGLLDSARRRPSVAICGGTKAVKLDKTKHGWRVVTSRGVIETKDVVIATNGYTGDLSKPLKRRLLPIASHVIATEELPTKLVSSLIPNGRTITDSKRVLCYYRQSPDGKRIVFGGRSRFTQVSGASSARILHRWMVERFPQLAGTRVTHAWNGNVAFTFDALPHTGVLDGLHYALGCNGSGVAMMTYLGGETARRILASSKRTCGFEREDFPTMPLYTGNPSLILPAVGAFYRFRDDLERTLAAWQRS